MNEFNADNQCELSYELLFLLKWLVEHDEQTIRKLISRAVLNGFNQELARQEHKEPDSTKAMQHSIIDFLGLMDFLVHEALVEHRKQKAYQSNLMSSINKIDANVCDTTVLQHSLDKTTEQLEQKNHMNPKELLYKEILKHWKPNVKKEFN